MAINYLNLLPYGLGAALDLSPLGGYHRQITFFDQVKYEMGGWLQMSGIPFVTARIFNGTIAVYTSAPMSASVNKSSKITDQPIEYGAMTSDHKIINPIEISVDLCIPTLETYIDGASGLLDLNLPTVTNEITQYFEQSKKIIIQTPTGIYRNMILESLPVNLTPNNIDRPIYNLKFRQVIIALPTLVSNVADVANANDADTVTTSYGSFDVIF